MADLTITSLRKGLNNSDPPTDLDSEQCTVAINVEFDTHPLGSRRLGCVAIDSPDLGDAVVFLFRHLPTDDQADAQLLALGVDDPTTAILKYKDTTWHTITPVDAIDVSGASRYTLDAVTLHGKLFIAYKSAVDRLHVWDGVSLRPTGLAEPAAPTAANSGGVGTLVGTRYYRVREEVQSGGAVLLRSEPSESLTFAPSTTNLSITVTKPATANTNSTHWVLEASIDNNIFNILATTAIGTTTVVDTTDYVAGYTGELSEDIGDYALLPSAEFVVADDDRLLFAGSHEDETLSSRFGWTPVFNDPGVGNNERSPIDTDNFKDLNTSEGGKITGMSRTVNGYIYIFKYGHIYQATRSGIRTRAYDVYCLTKVQGAVKGSIVEGIDQQGRPCLYFIDPTVGPSRIGDGGIQTCSLDIKTTWETINLEALVVTRSVFYSNKNGKQQVHWWLATDGATTPNLKLVLQTSATRQVEDSIRYGWVIHTGTIAEAVSTCLFSDNIDDDDDRSLNLVPFIGTLDGTILRCDTGTDDDGDAYAAQIITAPIVGAGILNTFGVMAAGLVAKAAQGVTVVVSAIRNFNATTLAFEDTVSLSPNTGEDPIIELLDEFSFEGCHALQLQFSDADQPTGTWDLDLFAMKPSVEETA